jgi:hypothetical protein
MNPMGRDEKTQRAIAEVQARIRAVYPDAEFRVAEGEEPRGIYIDAFTNADDSFCVFDLVSDWLVDLSITEGIHLHVIPLPKQPAAVAEES